MTQAAKSAPIGTKGTKSGAGLSSAPELCWFEEVCKEDVALVGGKCSSLGELINAGVRVPPGFALTTHGYARFMRDAGVSGEIPGMLKGVGHDDLDHLESASRSIREMIEAHSFAWELEDAVAEFYRKLSVRCICLLYTSPSPRDRTRSRMPSSA